MEAELWDGTGTVTLVWLGRRDIAGIEPGRKLVVHGRMTTLKGQRAIYNPRYELQPAAASEQ
jgi:DNA/RNA endonuclease YhcR with UshA esterase domain